jgi:hypothetical protein
MCLTNYGASEAVSLCSRYGEKSTKVRNNIAPVSLENKISRGLTAVCAYASKFFSSLDSMYIFGVLCDSSPRAHSCTVRSTETSPFFLIFVAQRRFPSCRVTMPIGQPRSGT